MNKKVYLFIIVILTIFNSCRKPYLPPIIATDSNYLVVEGVINTGQDSTIIKLSHTVPLSSTAGTKPELNCELDTLYYNNPKTTRNDVKEVLYSGSQIPIDRLQHQGAPHPYAYTGATSICVDCTLRGTNKAPSF